MHRLRSLPRSLPGRHRHPTTHCSRQGTLHRKTRTDIDQPHALQLRNIRQPCKCDGAVIQLYVEKTDLSTRSSEPHWHRREKTISKVHATHLQEMVPSSLG